MFPYLDDVLENDGGVFMLPGSHKSQFVRPPSLFGSYGQAERTAHENQTKHCSEQRLPAELPVGCLKPSVAAGDFIVLPEATVHGVIPWRTAERVRRTLSLRASAQLLHFFLSRAAPTTTDIDLILVLVGVHTHLLA